jgi:transcriptional regulator with GAF, ATPase, and Fis domain
MEATGWKVAGETGAAQLLGMNPSTLSSRMKALRIRGSQ